MSAVIDAFSRTPTPAQTTLMLQVIAIATDGQDIRVIDLWPRAGQRLPSWQPGAHIRVMLPTGITRAYSLCNSPDEQDFYRIVVKREANSRGASAWLHAHLQVGAWLQVSAPVDAFTLQASAQPAALFAAGIGITPIYAMAAALLQRGSGATLHYFARSAGHAALLGTLAQSQLAPHCSFHFGLIAEEVETQIVATLRNLPVVTPLYVCGPAPFIALLREQARRHGWRDADVHVEQFSAAAPATSAFASDDGFELVLQRSGLRCMVAPGQSIVAAAAALGVSIGTACGEGFCGSCQTRVLAGYPDHRDSVLSSAERIANQFLMPCVSRCRGTRLVLDL